MISFAVTAANQGEEDKVFEALNRLVDEDPSLRLGRDERMARLKGMEAVLSGQEDVISWTAGMSSSEHWNAVVNTAGLSETQHNTRASCGAEVTLQDPSGARPEDWFWAGHRHLAHLDGVTGS